MSKAEKRAQEAYPTWRNGIGDEFNTNSAYYGFIEGYRQAEKDNELTWEDIRDICRMWMESKTPFGVTGEALSIEVLKRFKERNKI